MAMVGTWEVPMPPMILAIGVSYLLREESRDSCGREERTGARCLAPFSAYHGTRIVCVVHRQGKEGAVPLVVSRPAVISKGDVGANETAIFSPDTPAKIWYSRKPRGSDVW